MIRATAVLIPALLAFGCASVPKVSQPDLDVATPEAWTAGSLAEGSRPKVGG